MRIEKKEENFFFFAMSINNDAPRMGVEHNLKESENEWEEKGGEKERKDKRMREENKTKEREGTYLGTIQYNDVMHEVGVSLSLSPLFTFATKGYLK